MNPYKELGVSETATPEEIRAAYLDLVKKYHPDKYTDPKIKEQAGERLKQINQAYEMLTKKPSSGSGGYDGGYAGGQSRGYGSSSYGGSSYSGSYSSQYSGPNATEFMRIRAYINQNNLTAAQSMLDQLTIRNAEWHYLYGIIYLRKGWYERAKEYFATAYEMEPDNEEYRNAYASLNRAGASYGASPFSGSDPRSCSFCSVCPALLCCNLCCGGRFCC